MPGSINKKIWCINLAIKDEILKLTLASYFKDKSDQILSEYNTKKDVCF